MGMARAQVTREVVEEVLKQVRDEVLRSLPNARVDYKVYSRDRIEAVLFLDVPVKDNEVALFMRRLGVGYMIEVVFGGFPHVITATYGATLFGKLCENDELHVDDYTVDLENDLLRPLRELGFGTLLQYVKYEQTDPTKPSERLISIRIDIIQGLRGC